MILAGLIAVLAQAADYEILRAGEPVGSARLNRTGQKLSVVVDCLEGGARTIYREESRPGVFAGRTAEFRVDIAQTRRPPRRLDGRIDDLRLYIDHAGAERRYLLGPSPYALVGEWALHSLFPLANSIPRREGSPRSFRVIWIPSGAALGLNGDYRGVVDALHRFELTAAGHRFLLDLDARGEVVRAESFPFRTVWRRRGYEPLDAGSEAVRARDERGQHNFDCREVRFGKSGELSGELCVSQEVPTAAAALLISGSGPQDRDGNGPPDKGPGGFLLRDLAYALSDVGATTLRFDDRGTGDSRGVYAEARWSDLVSDAEQALEFLLDADEVAGRPVVIVGHSEGALTALRLAGRERIAGLVLLGAPSEPISEVLVEQTRAILLRSSVAPTEISRRVEDLQRLLAWLAGNDPGVFPDDLPGMPPVSNLWWLKEHLAFRPERARAAVRSRVLLLHGQCDLQVDPRHAEANHRALRSSGVDAEIEVFPGLGHFLMQNPSGDTERALEPDRRVDPRVLERLVDWYPRDRAP